MDSNGEIANLFCRFNRNQVNLKVIIFFNYSHLIPVPVFTDSSVSSRLLRVTGCRLQVTGCRLQVAGYGLQVTGYRLQVAGCVTT